MQKRAARLTVLAVLLVAALGAGLVAWSAEQRVFALNSSEQEWTARLNRIAELVSALASVQLAYSASPQTNEGWFGHVSRLVERIETETISLEAQAHSASSATHLRALKDASGLLVQATARARDNLSEGRDLMAADLVLGETRESVDAMSTSLQRFRAAQMGALASDRLALEQRAWTVVAVVAGLWVFGLLGLSLVRGTPETSMPSPEILSLGHFPISRAEPVPEKSAVDLAAAAELCTAISRVTSSGEVPDLLARTATILDASGIILWMSAGDALVAIGSYGYEPSLISRISPIPLSAPNPTTEAWRTGEVRTATADGESNGAIAAPMLSPGGCVGVLAAEVRAGRENDEVERAVITMIAAQFSTTIAPWPAADPQIETVSEQEHHSDLPLKAAGA